MTDAILLIEDDTDIRESLRELLEGEDYRVICAVSANEGLRLLERHANVGLIILDYRLPDQNGNWFLERMKAIPSRATIPVLLTSAMNPHDLSAQGLGIVRKPFDLDLLLTRIRELLTAG